MMLDGKGKNKIHDQRRIYNEKKGYVLVLHGGCFDGCCVCRRTPDGEPALQRDRRRPSDYKLLLPIESELWIASERIPGGGRPGWPVGGTKVVGQRTLHDRKDSFFV
jgi:hypothetical protein